MIVLGIESATELVGAAVDDGTVNAASSVRGRRLHAENLAPCIDSVLERTRLALDQLDALAVDVGPGLFTGLRVGVATAKGLAQGLNIGVVGLCSLEVLAAAAFEAGWTDRVVPIIDGRRGEVFAACYQRGPHPLTPVCEVEPLCATPKGLVDGLERWAADVPVLACGDGAQRYRDQLGALRGVRFGGELLSTPLPEVLVRLARYRLEDGAASDSAMALQVRYLREPDAQSNWTRRTPVLPEGSGR